MSEFDTWAQICGLHRTTEIGEQFLESSKIGRYDDFPSQEAIASRMARLSTSLSYEGYPLFALPEPESIGLSLSEVILSRVSARAMRKKPIEISKMACLLHYSYGMTRDNRETTFPRPFRVVPSGGALYPLEIYFFCTLVPELPIGIYHYNASLNNVRLIRPGDQTARIAESLISFQDSIPVASSAIFFISALFERSCFKYGNRGYRFALLEAGHVAQNLNLVATGLGLGCLNIGGYYDRMVDSILGFDGVSQSTVYIVAVGEDGNSSR